MISTLKVVQRAADLSTSRTNIRGGNGVNWAKATKNIDSGVSDFDHFYLPEACGLTFVFAGRTLRPTIAKSQPW
jgi:hypothetical protein